MEVACNSLVCLRGIKVWDRINFWRMHKTIESLARKKIYVNPPRVVPPYKSEKKIEKFRNFFLIA